MSIDQILEKIKPYYPVFLGLTIATIFFGLGRLSISNGINEPISIENESVANIFSTASSTKVISTSTEKVSQKVVISKSAISVPENSNVIGAKTSKKYYFPWCGTVKRIKAENQVYFKTIEEAKAAGYIPGGNCKGLK